MIRNVVLFAALVWLGSSALAQAPQGPEGTWRASVDTPNGAFALIFQFAVDGEELTGSFSNSFISPIPIEEGEVNGNALSFKLTLETGMRLLYEGVLAGDELTLTTMVIEGGSSGGPEEQTFTAVRAE
jgi:hypothetical protein